MYIKKGGVEEMGQRASVIKENVQLLATKYPEVKDNYNLLIVKYWEHFEGIKSINEVILCTPSESITRAFRSLVRSGHIQISTKTKQQRMQERRNFIQHYHKEKI